MKLWIRSQERDTLEECTKLSAVPIITANKKHTTWGVVANFGCVGEYPTRERCIEIIDEIQKILTHNGVMLFKNIDVSEIPREALEPFKALAYLPNNDIKSEVTIHNAELVVYEMPEN